MVDIGVPDTEDLASTDKSILVDIVRSEMAAAGKNRQTMSDEELEVKMSEVKEEKDQEVQQEREAQQPVSQLERILNA